MEFRIVVKGIVLSDGKLLVVKRSPKDKINPRRLSVPAGFVKFREKPKEAIIREIKEETGLEVEVKRVTTVWTQILEKLQIIGINYLCVPQNRNIFLNEELESYQWINPETCKNLPKELVKEINFLKSEKII